MIQIARLAIVLLFLGAPVISNAQSSTALNVLILKLFGKHDNFVVESEFQMLDEKQKPAITLTLGIAVSEGKMRADADMNNAKGPQITKDVLEQVKATGEDRVISIIRPDKNRMLVIYPNRKCYDELAFPKDLVNAGKMPNVQKTPVANETLDGHPCVKKKVVMTDEHGFKQEMTVWEASDLKDFPIQVKLMDHGQGLIVHNRKMQFGKIDMVHFEVPAGFAKNPPRAK